MSEVNLYNLDNKDKTIFSDLKSSGKKIDVLYADVVFESMDFTWLELYLPFMKDNGVIQINTDWHTVAEWNLYLKSLHLVPINWCISIQEWGGVSKKYFPRKHDDILIFGMNNKWDFYPDKIRVKKVTAGTALDKSGTGLKIPCDVFYDLGNFHTMDLERIKLGDRNIQWQKPVKLLERLILPFLGDSGVVCDPVMGTATSGRVAQKFGYDFIGVEINPEVFLLAKKSLGLL